MFRNIFSPISRSSASYLLSGFCCPNVPGPSRAALSLSSPSSYRGYHTTPTLNLGRSLRKVEGGRFEPKKLEAIGEGAIPIRGQTDDHLYPDENTPTKLFNGIMFKDTPVINVKATSNNTLLMLTDSKGAVIQCSSCGLEGFRNARKSTNVAAQATGFSLGKKMMQKGIRSVRAKVAGLGAGRVASLKGMILAGVNIISLTDSTKVSWNPPRPRKKRRL